MTCTALCPAGFYYEVDESYDESDEEEVKAHLKRVTQQPPLKLDASSEVHTHTHAHAYTRTRIHTHAHALKHTHTHKHLHNPAAPTQTGCKKHICMHLVSSYMFNFPFIWPTVAQDVNITNKTHKILNAAMHFLLYQNTLKYQSIDYGEYPLWVSDVRSASSESGLH